MTFQLVLSETLNPQSDHTIRLKKKQPTANNQSRKSNTYTNTHKSSITSTPAFP
jgi:hypothetical protein